MIKVRYGAHCGCPLVHRIVADREGSGVLCVDAEILAPPPIVMLQQQQQQQQQQPLGNRLPVPEVEELYKHELVKVREKVRVFRLSLNVGESVDIDYSFYHLLVMCVDGILEELDKSTGYSHTKECTIGDMNWSGPVGNRMLTNIGSTVVTYFVLQWRNFSC